jgi:hypothetical protein
LQYGGGAPYFCRKGRWSEMSLIPVATSKGYAKSHSDETNTIKFLISWITKIISPCKSSTSKFHLFYSINFYNGTEDVTLITNNHNPFALIAPLRKFHREAIFLFWLKKSIRKEEVTDVPQANAARVVAFQDNYIDRSPSSSTSITPSYIPWSIN